MKRKFLVVFLAIVTALCMAFGPTACGEKGNETGNNPPITDPSGNQGSQGTQGGTQKPDDGGQGETPAPHVHSYGEWKVETPATHTQEGKERQYCECGEYNERSIPKTEGHTFGEWKVTKKSTCKEAGTKERSCACGEKETEPLPLVGHDFENMTCKVCETKASLGLEYTLINEDKEYEVSSLGDCTDTDLVITNNYDGKPVTSIGSSAFYECSGLTSVTIPNSVTSIGSSAFNRCIGLTSVTIPDSVTSIGDGAFIRCSGLISVTIPDSVTSIGRNAFYGCNGLTTVTIPENVTEIGSDAFNTCENLTTVIWNAKNCKEVYSLSLEPGLFNKTKLQKVTFGEGILSIPNRMFYGCTKLTDLVLPETLTSIGEYVFGGTDYLEKNGEKDESGVIYLGKYLMGASEKNSGKYEIKEGTTVIASAALMGCGFTEISIPDSVITIGAHAFARSELKSELKIPDSVTSIENNAFENCLALTSVVIGDGVTSIENSTFLSCTELTSVTIGKSVRSIGEMAFAVCGKLRSVNISDSVTEICENAFASCSSLASVTIPKNVISIESAAFWKCSGLTSVTIGSGVTSIGNAAFYGCDALKDVHFENPKGWKASRYEDMSNTEAISGLDNTETAAKYLTKTYCGYFWKREG